MDKVKENKEGRNRSLKHQSAIVFTSLVTLVCVAIHAIRQSGPTRASAAYGWNNDWNAAERESEASGKPTIALFTAEGNAVCRKFAVETLENEQVQQVVGESFTPVVFDISERTGESLQRSRELNVQTVPMLILYDRNGKEQARAVGMPAKEMLTWLKSGGSELGPVLAPAADGTMPIASVSSIEDRLQETAGLSESLSESEGS